MSEDIALGQKLDSILNSIVILTEKVNNFDSKLSTLGTRLDKIENTLSDKINKMENQMLEKADKSELEELRLRLLHVLEDLKKDQKASAVMKESYEKRLNILIHGVQESPGNAWERPDETIAHVYDFIKAGLQIKDPTEIALADCHRLPQGTTFSNRKEKLTWPIIIKLINAMDKRRIFTNLHNLKPYNQQRRLSQQSAVYVTEHLPKQFQEERKQLLPRFKEVKRLSKKTFWKAEDGHYALYIDNIKVKLH